MHMGFGSDAETREQLAFSVNTAAHTGVTAEVGELQCHISKSEELSTIF